MGERLVLLRFQLANLLKGSKLAQTIEDLLTRSQTRAKQVTKDMEAAERSTTTAVRQVESVAAPTGRRSALDRVRAPELVVGQRIQQGIGNAGAVAGGLGALTAGGALSAGLSSQLAFALPQTAITAISLQVTGTVLREADKLLEERFRARDSLLKLEVERALETSAQRRRRDPYEDQRVREEVSRDLQARRAYEARRGIEPTAARAAGE